MSYATTTGDNVASSSMSLSPTSRQNAYCGSDRGNPINITYSSSARVYFFVNTTNAPAPDSTYYVTSNRGYGYSDNVVYGDVLLSEDTFTFNESNLTATASINTGVQYTYHKRQITTITATAGTGVSKVSIRVRDQEGGGSPTSSPGTHDLPWSTPATTTWASFSVYGYVTLEDDYAPASGWSLVSGTTNVYYVGQTSCPGYTQGGTVNLGTFNAIAKATYTINFSSTYCNWDYPSRVAVAGDYIYISGTTVTCKIGGSSGATR